MKTDLRHACLSVRLCFHPIGDFLQDNSQIHFDVACQRRVVNIPMLVMKMMRRVGKMTVMWRVVPAQEWHSRK